MLDFITPHPVDRRLLLKSAALAAGLGMGAAAGGAKAAATTKLAGMPRSLTGKTIGLMLGHEQFTGPQLTEIGTAAANAGFQLLATSDHFQPWQANEGHSSQAWVTMGALGSRIGDTWMGTTVT